MSENVFADLRVPNPEEQLRKAAIVHGIGQAIAEKQWTLTQAGECLGIAPEKLAALLDGQFRGYTLECLLRFVTALEGKVLVGSAA